MTNVIKDVSTLTSIPEKTLQKLNEKILFSICETIQEDAIAENPITELDLGLFKIYIKHDGSDIKYKLIPNADMEKAVASTAKNKLNLLEDTLNDALAKKFTNIYKDIC